MNFFFQDLVQQIARQRDMFRKLLQDAANTPSRVAAAADLQLIASADAQIARIPALQVKAETFKLAFIGCISMLDRHHSKSVEFMNWQYICQMDVELMFGR